MKVAMDFSEIKRRCEASESSFHSLGTNVGTQSKPAILVDRGSKVLAVAHLDYVSNSTHFQWVKIKDPKTEEYIIYSGQLDNRLGVYVALDLLPKIGIMPDVLLTTDEEFGQSTARWATLPKSYNWGFMFDRAGTDVVMYHYETKELRKMLEGAGFRVGTGTYSCISDMEYAGCKMFNVGCGMADYHSKYSHFSTSDLLSQVAKFQNFWSLYSDQHLPHVESPSRGFWTPLTPINTKVVCKACNKNVEVNMASYSWKDKGYVCLSCAYGTDGEQAIVDSQPVEAEEQPEGCAFCESNNVSLFLVPSLESWLCMACIGKVCDPHDAVITCCEEKGCRASVEVSAISFLDRGNDIFCADHDSNVLPFKPDDYRWTCSVCGDKNPKDGDVVILRAVHPDQDRASAYTCTKCSGEFTKAGYKLFYY